MAKLLVGESRYDLDPAWKCSIGFSDDNVIVLNRTGVSRKHAVLECNAGKWRIVDLESTNGTVVNGKGIDRPQRLKDRDVILLGGERLLFAQSELVATPPLEDKSNRFLKILIENRYRSLSGLAVVVAIVILMVFPVGFSDPVPDCSGDESRSLAIEVFNKNRVEFGLPFFAVDAIDLRERAETTGSGNYKVCDAVIVAKAEESGSLSSYNVPVTYDLSRQKGQFLLSSLRDTTYKG